MLFILACIDLVVIAAVLADAITACWSHQLLKALRKFTIGGLLGTILIAIEINQGAFTGKNEWSILLYVTLGLPWLVPIFTLVERLVAEYRDMLVHSKRDD